jgi:aldehyde dehydrogenase (NAD+)
MVNRSDIFVGGVWRAGGGERLTSVNPADGSLIAEFAAASRADVDESVEAGRRAAAESGWRGMLPHQRARILYRIGEAIEADVDALSALQTLDTGKTLAETRALALSAAGTFRYIAAALETSDEVLTTPRGPYLSMSIHEPIGVVGAITPWNSPIASDAQKVAPALAAGNAVIVKPAEWTPMVSLRLARICEAAGLPSGLLSVLPGSGADIGDAIVRHPGVGKVAFTGGTVTGRRIAAVAAEKLMPVSLELGGGIADDRLRGRRSRSCRRRHPVRHLQLIGPILRCRLAVVRAGIDLPRFRSRAGRARVRFACGAAHRSGDPGRPDGCLRAS